jgi:hypothetical protein
MDFRIPEPCHERWEDMQPRGEGRFCERCQHTVVDLTRMSRRQAERRLKKERGDYLCIQLALDPLERPVFRPEPSRAAHWAGGLVLVAALTAGGCSAGGDEGAEVAQLEPEPCPVDAPPMLPVADGPMVPVDTEEATEASVATGPIEAEVTDDDPEPTPEQRELTRRKQEQQQIAAHPPIRHVRGRMPLRRPPTSTF